MPTHMVIFRSAEGKPGFHQTEGLDEAIRFVEHLRNVEMVPDANVFKLTPVPLEVKTYYKVEVADDVAVRRPEPVESPAPPSGGLGGPVASAAPAATSAPVADAAPSPVPASASAEPVANDDLRPGAAVSPLANGGSTARFGRFNRG